jgi:hypothetical protein
VLAEVMERRTSFEALQPLILCIDRLAAVNE